jgi:ATP-dependent Clp protease protease subunit
MTEDETVVEEPVEEEGVEGFDLATLIGGSSQEVWRPDTVAFFGSANRSILMSGEVDQSMADAMIGQLLQLDEESNDPIVVYINTPGGELDNALAIYDTMQTVASPIFTIAVGSCMSAGLLLLQGGDVRSSMPRTRLMYHEPMAGANAFNSEGADAFAANYAWAKQQMKEILTEGTNITEKVWKDTFAGKTAMFLSAQEALELDLLDVIMTYADKAVLPDGK